MDVSASREGSVSPNTRKRKKINAARRKSTTESNSLLGESAFYLLLDLLDLVDLLLKRENATLCKLMEF